MFKFFKFYTDSKIKWEEMSHLYEIHIIYIIEYRKLTSVQSSRKLNFKCKYGKILCDNHKISVIENKSTIKAIKINRKYNYIEIKNKE